MKTRLEDLKKFIREQELLTRRLIVKNSRKNDFNNLQRQLNVLRTKEKIERKLRKNILR